jgi:choline dehydrogenase-like flavoprotein
MPQVVRSAPVHDVVVIGSGAGGGTVTKVLADLGVKVTLLEAGPNLNPARDYKEHKWAHDYPHRGAGEDGRHYFNRGYPFGYFLAPNGYWDIPGEPYTAGSGSQFRWFRSRILGGRTNHYGRITLRFADYDFQPIDGLSDPWPVTYDEIAPWYDKAEAFIGVTGTKEGLRTAPDGVFQAPPAPRVHEILAQRSCRNLGIPCVPSRMAIITKSLNGRAPCHYCGQCGRGCVTASNYSSSQVQIFPALKTGRVQLITGAMARELITDASGKVVAVSYIDKATRTEKQIRCRAVVVAASACESARLLLNSKSPRHPNGLANSSGVVGRYLTDTVGFSMRAQIPALEGMPMHDTDGFGGMHVYVPWWELDKPNKDFPRGYHIEIGGGYSMPMPGLFDGVCRRHEGYGASLKQAIKQDYGTWVGLAGRGEMIPNRGTYCEIDPQIVDQWGIPVLRFHFQWADSEVKMVEHMERTFRAILEGMGGTVMPDPRPATAKISVGGEIIHELGTVRMGLDPTKSALNKYLQAHDVKNLFVADAAGFVSNPDKNPTLSICAFAWRAAEYLAEEMRKGNV